MALKKGLLLIVRRKNDPCNNRLFTVTLVHNH